MSRTDIIEPARPAKEDFKDIVESWQDMVYNTALGIVQNSEDAEDITQEVFITVYEKLDDFREEALVSTWIYKITVHRALDHEKRKKRQKYGGLLKRIFSLKNEDEPVNFEHPGVQLDNKEKASVLFRSMKKLPDKQRLAFTLQKVEGLNNREIASIMDTTVQAVESLLARARGNLKTILKDYYKQL
ncbi:MAG TPA: RNA polymerase sigma factor [Ferruginibacter sp.]|nr:RNA polymerase sigma factor [Ferruginibacter sp.]